MENTLSRRKSYGFRSFREFFYFSFNNLEFKFCFCEILNLTIFLVEIFEGGLDESESLTESELEL